MMPKRYNATNTCEKIKENGKMCGEPLGYTNALQERDNEGNPTGRWICRRHYNIDYNKRPGCGNNLLREMRDSRTGNLDQDSAKAKGDIFEAVTCGTRGVRNLNIENDNFHSKIDHSIDQEYGIIQTKGAIYNSRERFWYANWINEQEKQFDNLIFYCMDKYRKNIERVYVFPYEEVIKRKGVTIYNNSTSHWYDKYRVGEDPYNDVYQKLV